MRFYGVALVASALVLNGCGNGNQTDADTTAAAGESAATAQAAAVTGTVHEVRMLGDESGYRYDPASITIRQGDGIRWTMVSGPPHDVNFDETQIQGQARAQLDANMPNQPQPGSLQSPMMMQENETYTVSFANVPPGTYDYICTPHIQQGMRGSVTVQQ